MLHGTPAINRGAIVASVKDRDEPNDKSAKLSREGAYRLALCLTPERFAKRFGQPPRRPPKGGVVDLAGYDLSRLGELMPQPVHAWMRWLQILSPSRSTRASSTICSPPTTNTSGGPRPRPGRRS